MKFFPLPLILAAAALAATVPLAQAQDANAGKKAGDIMLRLRAIGVVPETTSSTVTPIGGSVTASDTVDPEFDATYFFTDHIAAELIAAVTRHHIRASGTSLGAVDVGEVSLLPPTLTLQYHFMPKSAFSPYLGAGINYTWFYDSSPAGSPVKSVRYADNWGAVLQAGIDYNITGNYYLNVDVKQVFLSTTANINGGAIQAKVGLDPTIVGLGVGYKF